MFYDPSNCFVPSKIRRLFPCPRRGQPQATSTLGQASCSTKPDCAHLPVPHPKSGLNPSVAGPLLDHPDKQSTRGLCDPDLEVRSDTPIQAAIDVTNMKHLVVLLASCAVGLFLAVSTGSAQNAPPVEAPPAEIPPTDPPGPPEPPEEQPPVEVPEPPEDQPPVEAPPFEVPPVDRPEIEAPSPEGPPADLAERLAELRAAREAFTESMKALREQAREDRGEIRELVRERIDEWREAQRQFRMDMRERAEQLRDELQNSRPALSGAAEGGRS
jgi:hypothetical protein